MNAPLKAREPITVPVALGNRAYEIVIGRGLLGSLGGAIKALRPGARAVVVTDENVAAHHLAATEAALTAAGIASSRIVVAPGEGSKTVATFERVCEDIIAARIERGDLAVALGGGVIGDLTGFAASCVRAVSISCRCRRRCWRKSTPRWAARPASIRVTART